MTITEKFHRVVGEKAAKDSQSNSSPDAQAQLSADNIEIGPAPVNEATGVEDLKPEENAQFGVKKIEAVTLTWNKSSVYVVLIL